MISVCLYSFLLCIDMLGVTQPPKELGLSTLLFYIHNIQAFHLFVISPFLFLLCPSIVNPRQWSQVTRAQIIEPFPQHQHHWPFFQAVFFYLNHIIACASLDTTVDANQTSHWWWLCSWIDDENADAGL